ncbi:MAG: PspA/IM30 family protein, partial [Zetaproteobacteria bacterium]|nr:PspA/IM30 family protein [Zetaproteobacteria bacterium]
MVGIFKRLFRVASANTHSAIDKLEDPIKLTEQGIRDLRKDLEQSIQSLAEAKSMLIRMKKEAQEKKQLASSYENKAVLLLKKAESGALDSAEADRLATAALEKKQTVLEQSNAMFTGLDRQTEQTQVLEKRVGELRSNINKWENELKTLKARARVAEASKKLNKQLAQVDSSGTIALLEKMKDKVSENEAMAESYADIGGLSTNIDDEIQKALGSSSLNQLKEGESNAQDSLAALKAKLGQNT